MDQFCEGGHRLLISDQNSNSTTRSMIGRCTSGNCAFLIFRHCRARLHPPDRGVDAHGARFTSSLEVGLALSLPFTFGTGAPLPTLSSKRQITLPKELCDRL